MYSLCQPAGRCAAGRRALSSLVMDDLRLPITERLSARQWTGVDVVLAAVLAAASVFSVALVGGTTPAGSWTVVRYLAVAAACGSLLFRRRFPLVVLGVVGVSVAFLNVLGGQRNIDAGGGGLAVLALTFAAYSVAVTSTRRTSLTAIGVAVGAIEIGALVAAGGPDWRRRVTGSGAGRRRLAGRRRTPERGASTSREWSSVLPSASVSASNGLGAPVPRRGCGSPASCTTSSLTP